jgi:hypothetical protein
MDKEREVIEPRKGQIFCKLHIESEYRSYDYEVQDRCEIEFIDLQGKKLKIIPRIIYREF